MLLELRVMLRAPKGRDKEGRCFVQGYILFRRGLKARSGREKAGEVKVMATGKLQWFRRKLTWLLSFQQSLLSCETFGGSEFLNF